MTYRCRVAIVANSGFYITLSLSLVALSALISCFKCAITIRHRLTGLNHRMYCLTVLKISLHEAGIGMGDSSEAVRLDSVPGPSQLMDVYFHVHMVFS